MNAEGGNCICGTVGEHSCAHELKAENDRLRIHGVPTGVCPHCMYIFGRRGDPTKCGCFAKLRGERDRFRDALTLIASPNRATYEQPLDAWKIAYDALDRHREFDS